MIPSSALKRNVGRTVATLEKEGTYPSVGLSWRKVILDNFTDPLMVNTAYSVDSRRPLRSAMLNFRYESREDSVNQIANLRKLYLNEPVKEVGYERYWHGYLVYLRPLLLVFSYDGIRNVATLGLLFGFISIAVLAWRKVGAVLAFVLAVGLAAVDFEWLGRSLQFSGVFLVGLFSAIYFLSRYKKGQPAYFLFFAVGGLTAFFDLLTAPLVTLGLVLVVATAYGGRDLRTVLIRCFFWSLGYLSLWASKWILAEVFFSSGAILTSFDQVVNRTVTPAADGGFNPLKAVSLNFFQMVGYDRRNKFVLLYAFIVLAVFFHRYRAIDDQSLKKAIPWVFISIIPYLWYLVAANHSYYHPWYTYRNQLMSISGAAMIYAGLVDWQKFIRDLAGLRRLGQRLTKGASKKRYH